MKNQFNLLGLAFFIFLLLPLQMKSQGCIDAGVHYPDQGITHSFRGSNFAQSAAFETPLNDDWIDFSGHIDAAFYAGDGKTVLISGDRIAIVDSNNINELNPTTSFLSFAFSFLPSNFMNGIDAAFAEQISGNDYMVYFFKGNQWIRFSYNLPANQAVYQATGTGSGWGGVFSDYFTNGIDAAYYFSESNLVFFLSGDQVIYYNTATGMIDTSLDVPSAIMDSLAGLFPIWWSCTGAVDNGSCNINYALPDYGCAESSEFPIAVETSVGTSLGNDVRVSSFSVYIEHPSVGDLMLSLVSPSGQECFLAINLGADGNNYGTSCANPTVFSDNAPTLIGLGEAPFTGEYIPINILENVFNDGSSPQGVWTLKVCDTGSQDDGIDNGTIQFVDIQFDDFSTSNTTEIEGLSSLSVHPNPSSGIFTLNVELESAMNLEIEIYSLDGRLIKRIPGQQLKSFQSEINLVGESDGGYITKIILDNGVVVRRILKGN